MPETPQGQAPGRSIACRDVLGRDGHTFVSVSEEGRVVVRTPAPAAGTFDWRGVEELIAALMEARRILPGTPS